MFATVICNFFELLYARLVYCDSVAKKSRWRALFPPPGSTPLDPEHIVLKIQGHAVILQQIGTET